MIRKNELDAGACKRTGSRYSKKAVREITRAFIYEIVDSLIEGEEVSVDALGTLSIVPTESGKVYKPFTGRPKNGVGTGKKEVVGCTELRVYFKKSLVFQRRLKEKYRGKVRRRRKRQEG